jgi:NADP-dependent 3-hydroxy acid dehydrogenase YdfG
MEPENGHMPHSLKTKVVAIPLATSGYGVAIADWVMKQDGRLALGASAAQFPALDATIDGRDGVYCQPLDLDRPKSASEFFQIAFAQFERLDVVVLEVLPVNAKRMTTEKQIELGTRRLLHCLDAALPYIGSELHFICIAPAYGPAVIPIATAFLGAKLSATGATAAPSIRMSVVSPPAALPPDEISFARTIVHLMKEPQSPDIMETVLPSRRKSRRPQARRLVDGQGKIGAQA